jgi:2-polyprenyl-3-methyl-5-hydroxy-6-metoxy-1,4-benzoquinol methylase
MAEIISYTACPNCGSQQIAPAINCKDYTVSQKMFAVWQCNSCQLRFTQDVPSQDAIGPYYQSDAYISHTDTDQGLISKLYKMARNYTLKSKLKTVQKTTGKLTGKILDIGAGTGAFLKTMSAAGWQATGLEPDAGARKICNEKYGLELKNPDELFNVEPASQDAVTMWHVLEHVHELQAYIGQIKKILTPHGAACIALPNYLSGDAQHYEACWAAYDVPRHLYHFCPTAMRKLAAQNGLEITAMQPMWFDAFYISMLSEKYKNGKGNLIKAVWNGLMSNLKAMGNKERCSSLIYVLKKTNQ